MNRMIEFKLTQCLIALFLLFATQAFAHEGHDKAPGEAGDSGATGPVLITAEAKKNLALEVAEAQVRTLDKTVTLIGQIEGIPNRSAAITSRISGRVVGLLVTEGQQVKKGQALVEVESRQPGEPPPRVKYTSPIDGVVTDRHAILGDTVEPDKHLLEVMDLNEVYAEGRIYEGQVPWIKIGQKARVLVESYPDKLFNGTVELMGGALDAESRTLKVWIRIPNEDGLLRPNMRATLNIVTGEAESVVAVPKSAVLGESGQFFVFVQSDTNDLEFERRTVVTGITDDQFIEAIEGVYPSDKVVTVGNYQLQYVTPKPKAEKADEHQNEGSHPGFLRRLAWGQLILGFIAGMAVTIALGRRFLVNRTSNREMH